MNEKHVLLKVEEIDDNVMSTECKCHSVEDFGKVITSIMLMCKENRLFNLMLLDAIINLHESKEFNEALEWSSVDCPDFNSLLKNNG